MIPWYLKHEKYGAEPWAVQREALNRSEGKSRYGHFLEQGLGKTALILNEFIHYHELGLIDCLFVVCPKSFQLSWLDALQEWGVRDIAAAAWPEAFPIGPLPVVYIMNWEAIRTEAGLKFIGKLKRKVFLALDEASYIKNPSSKVTKRAMQISRGARFVRLLNGTPQTNSIEDYYGQLKCLNELDGFLRTTFRKHFAVMGGWEQKKVVGTRNDEEFAQILARCSFRATKDAWRKDLPPRIISTVKVEMTPAQRRHYLEMKNDFITKIKDEKIKADLVLTQLAKLRQISSGIVINSGKETKIEEIENNPKFKALLELYNGQKGKVIVVYTYKLTGKMLGEFFTREKISHVYIAGQMEPAHLAAQKHAFNNDPNCRVILCQQAAACM